MIGFAQVTNSRFTETSKALQLQVVAAQSDDGSASEVGFADAFAAWCIVAVPLRPSADAAGTITAACEAAVMDGADERTVLGTRDLRVSKFAQDLKPGECAFVNAWGSRLAMREKTVALNHGGGFLAFDSAGGTVSLVGMPSTPGGSAPYLSINATTIGLTSATGQASLAVSGADVTLNAATVTARASQVLLGIGATDSIVAYSTFVQALAQISASLVALGRPALLMPQPGRCVKVPLGG